MKHINKHKNGKRGRRGWAARGEGAHSSGVVLEVAQGLDVQPLGAVVEVEAALLAAFRLLRHLQLADEELRKGTEPAAAVRRSAAQSDSRTAVIGAALHRRRAGSEER